MPETRAESASASAAAAPRRLWQASTPSLGLRLWLENDAVCLQAANEGGRGTATTLVVLPVRWESSSRVQPLMDLTDFADPGAGGRLCRKQHFRSPPQTLPTPFPARFSGAEWTALSLGQPWVVVLLLFDKPDTALRQAGDCTDTLAAMRAFFSGDQPLAWLRRGLVYLDLKDVPHSAATPAAAAARPARPGAPTPTLAPTLEPAPEPALQPLPAPEPYTFALGSCHYPAGLMDGTPQDYQPGTTQLPGPADAALLRLARRLDELDNPDRPSLLVLAGDQIYADATAGLFDPRAGTTPQHRAGLRDAADWLRIPYQNLYGSVGAQSVLGRLRSIMVLDDHEIDDNWEPLPAPADPRADRYNQALRNAGRQAYLRYQRDLPNAALPNALWRDDLQHRGIRFFLADSRTERDPRKAAYDPCQPRIMGCRQTARLNRWLTEDPQRPAFFVSPSMLLPRRRRSAEQPRAALHSDAWDGYPGSLHALLAKVCQLGRSNLVFLSGDEHLSCVVEATITDLRQTEHQVKLHSVHSSGLYAPYPFANAVPEQFALPDAWDFSDPADPASRYRCQVRLCQPWAPGDGFALLRLTPPEGGIGFGKGPGGDAWQLSVRFDRAAAPTVACSAARPEAAAQRGPALQLLLGPPPQRGAAATL